MTNLFALLGTLYSNIVPFVILLGILIFVHELGHFLVARACGVRVEVFSLGFGKKLLSIKRGDTTYCVSLVPLGGYVKMFGELGSDAIKTDADKLVSYSHKTPWQRIAIVLAGPLMNFFFAVLVFGGIAHFGEQTRAAVIADVAQSSPAEQMGLTAGDKILEVNSVPVRSYEEFQKNLNKFKGSTVSALVADSQGSQKTISLNVSIVDNPNIFSLDNKLGQIEGILPYAKSATIAVLVDTPAYKIGFRTGDEITEINSQKIIRLTQLDSAILNTTTDLIVKLDRPANEANLEKPVKTSLSLTIPVAALKNIKQLEKFGFDNTELYLDQVVKDSPAAIADLNKFDKMVSINSKPIKKWEDISETIKSFDGKEAMIFVINRDGAEVIKKITPKVTELTNAFGGIDKRFTVGITPLLSFANPEIVVVKSDSLVASVEKGFNRTIDISVMTVMSFVKLFQGQVSVKNVGGMISIGKAAKDSYANGGQEFFMTMGILSVSLFIMNLLPIPVLDGGHLVFYTIELIKGSPLSLRKMEIAQQVGFVLLLGLMILAQFNDIVRFLFKS
ncbi:MAG: RIP metalloprotease RseP [Pseudobdellovibrio sp.]